MGTHLHEELIHIIALPAVTARVWYLDSAHYRRVKINGTREVRGRDPHMLDGVLKSDPLTKCCHNHALSVNKAEGWVRGRATPDGRDAFVREASHAATQFFQLERWQRLAHRRLLGGDTD